jgi:hypothetical protein
MMQRSIGGGGQRPDDDADPAPAFIWPSGDGPAIAAPDSSPPQQNANGQ